MRHPRTYYEYLDTLRNRFRNVPPLETMFPPRSEGRFRGELLLVATLPAVVLTPALRPIVAMIHPHDHKLTVFMLVVILLTIYAFFNAVLNYKHRLLGVHLCVVALGLFVCFFWQTGVQQLLVAHAFSLLSVVIISDALTTHVIETFGATAHFIHPDITDRIRQRWQRRWQDPIYLDQVATVVIAYSVGLVVHCVLVRFAVLQPRQAALGIVLLAGLLAVASVCLIAHWYRSKPSPWRFALATLVAFQASLQEFLLHTPHAFAPGSYRNTHLAIRSSLGRTPLPIVVLVLNQFAASMIPTAAYFPITLLWEQNLAALADVSGEHVTASPKELLDFYSSLNGSPEAWITLAPSALLSAPVFFAFTLALSFILCLTVPTFICLTLCFLLTGPQLLELRYLELKLRQRVRNEK